MTAAPGRSWFAGFDPGRSIGVALLGATPSSHQIGHTETTRDVVYCGSLIAQWAATYAGLTVVVEDFVGAGPRTSDGNYTLKVVGYLTWKAEEQGVVVIVTPSQSRLAGMTEAKQLVAGGTGHSIDAMAHAVAAARRRWS